MIDLLLSLVNFKQREVVVVAVQRTEIYETDALPVLNLGFAANLFDCVSPTSPRGGGNYRPWLRSVRHQPKGQPSHPKAPVACLFAGFPNSRVDS
jgi:hypothetical protein